MDIETIILILLLANLILLIYFVFLHKKDSNTEEITGQITLDLMRSQNQQKTELQDLYSQKSGQLFSSIQENFSQNKLQNQTQFYDLQKQLQDMLQTKLDELQNLFQARLNAGLSNLSDLNQKELLKLQSATTHNLEVLRQSNQQKLEQINQDVQKRLDENFAQNLKSFQEVSQNLGRIESTAQKMIESTKSVDKLNTIFARTSSKAFGGFAEDYLESLLRENLVQNSWKKQVQVLNSTEKIDFVIYLGDKKIGIDAKFPMTVYQDYLEAEIDEKQLKLKNYLQQVCNMAIDISGKYYKNNFVHSLLLYLPSDSMYNEVVNQPKYLEILQKAKVTCCSPSIIFPLITLIQTYQFKENISKNAEAIIKGLSQVRQNVSGFKEEFRKLGEKLNQAQKNYDQAGRNLDGVEQNILQLEDHAN